MKHPNALILEKLYSDLAKGDLEAVLKACSESMTFQISGKSKIAGKYTKTNFASELVSKWNELSNGTYQLEVHDILAGDQHVAVLASARLTRDGKPAEYRTAHVWRFGSGQPLAWYEYPRDLYQFDSIWS